MKTLFALQREMAEEYRQSGDRFYQHLKRVSPIVLDHLGDREFERLIDTFFAEYKVSSPYVWQLPRELWEWAKNRELKPAYLIDLLHFEWLNVEVHMMPDVAAPPVCPRGELLVLNPEFRLARFDHPVYRGEWEKKECYVLAFRHPDKLNVCFIELCPLYVVIIEALAEQPLSREDALEVACRHLGINVESADAFFSDLLEQRAILGFLEGKQ